MGRERVGREKVGKCGSYGLDQMERRTLTRRAGMDLLLSLRPLL